MPGALTLVVAGILALPPSFFCVKIEAGKQDGLDAGFRADGEKRAIYTMLNVRPCSAEVLTARISAQNGPFRPRSPSTKRHPIPQSLPIQIKTTEAQPSDAERARCHGRVKRGCRIAKETHKSKVIRSIPSCSCVPPSGMFITLATTLRPQCDPRPTKRSLQAGRAPLIGSSRSAL